MAKEEKTLDDQTAENFEQKLEEAGIAKAPDGGYGWLIVLASFLANTIVDGTIFTVGGILLPIWVKDFNASEAATALNMSILSGSYLLVGPIASALANLYGCRAVVIAGSILACFGFAISSLAPQIYFLYVSFGLIGGVGFGLIYLPSIVIVAQYFSEKRSLATGLAVCGSGIGTTLFSWINPPVMKALGTNWRYFVVYIALVTLLCIISALIYKPIRTSNSQIQKVVELVDEYDNRTQVDSKTTNGVYSEMNPDRPFLSTIELNTAAAKQTGTNCSQKDLMEAVARESVRELNRPLSKKDIFYSGSTQNIAVRSRTASLSKGDGSKGDALHESTIFLNGVGRTTDDVGASLPKTWKQNLAMTLGALLDTSLLYSPSFLILAFSGFLTLSCFYVPYIYIGNHLKKLPDVDDSSVSNVIGLLGILNILARIVCGWIADRPQVNALIVSNVALTAAGLATCAVPFFTQYWHFIAFCVPFAAGVACFAALRSVICLDLVGLEKLSNAFGILLTFMGVGAVVGSPFAAFLKDVTNNYDASFYIMGSLMTLSGVICFPLRQIRQWELRRLQAKEASKSVELQSLTAPKGTS